MESTEPVRVAVNIRPLTSHELLSGCTGCITVTPNEPKVHIDGHAFTYDFVFGNSGLPSLKIYGYCVAPLVEALFTGYNSTVLTYGQTASGKTYTMGTNHSGDRTNGGIIQKVMEDVFTRVEATKDLTKTLIRISFIEVYNEEVFDLLASNPSRVPIQIRETASGEITLKGVTEVEVKTKEEMGSYLARGSFSRATGSTNMNSQSSRSHAIFTISLQITTAKHILCAKLRLVDLAGSERATRTGASGRRLIEGNHINRGLLALVNVISILGDERKRKKGVHVPYRDSKLTRLLQDSLGGNSKTVIIACVSPAFANAEETLNTLRYAKRSRNIRNKTVVQPKPSAPSCDADDAMFKECHVLSRSSDSCSQAKPSVPSFGYDAMFKECHVFSGSSDSHSQAKPSEPSFGYDAMFKELTPPESESLPVYDTPVYDEEDVSDAFSELKIRWTSQSASFEDVSSSTSSPSKLSKPAGYDVVFEAIPELARSDECYSSPPSNVSKQNSSQPAVYDDVFEAIPELAKFDECSSSSLSNVSIPNSSPLDDLIGNLVKEPEKTESEQEDKGQNKPVDIIDLTADETEFQEKGPFIDLTADEIEFQEKGPFIDLTADETEFQEKGPFIDLTADETEFQHCSPQEKLGMKLKELEKSLEETEAEIRGNYEEKVHKLQKEKRAMQREIEALKRKIASLSSSATSCCTCSKMSACKTVRCQCSVTSRFCISSCGCSAGKCSNRSREERLVEKIPRL